MVFDFISKTAQSAVNLTCDTADMLTGGGDGPRREDVAQLLAAGLTVAAAAEVLGVAESVVEEIAGEE